MARLMTCPPKFTHSEWTVSNQRRYAAAEGERAASERLTDQIASVIDETNFTAAKLEAEVGRKFDERIKDVKYWEEELEHKLEQIVGEVDSLSLLEVRLSQAIDSLQEPLQLTKACLASRTTRVGIDLVRDNVELNLEKEVEVFEGVLALFYRSKEQLVEQIRLLRKSKYNLEKDLKDKFASLAIDSHSKQLKPSTLQFTKTTSKINSNSSCLPEWEGFSEAGLRAAESQRQDGVALRALVNQLLADTHADLCRQNAATQTAFKRRIEETKDAKMKLENHLALVRTQMLESEASIAQLDAALAGTSAPLQLAQRRLEQRAQRPNVEQCRDAVQFALVAQATSASASAGRLQEALASAHASLKGLRRQSVELEDELQVKLRSMEVDEMHCQTIRSSIHLQPF